MSTEIITDVLDLASHCFKNARGNLMQGAKYLHQISNEKLWEGQYSSFNEFLEQDCQISPGYASKLIKVYEYYVIQSGVSPRKLEAVDVEKSYMAINLNGQPEHKLLKAAEWNRQELKDALAEGPNGEECSHKVLIIKHQCKACSRFIDVNWNDLNYRTLQTEG